MKTLLKAILVLPLMYVMAGCGPKAQPAQTNPSTPPASQPVPSAVPGAPPG